MKSLAKYVQEKLVIKKNKSNNYKYFPKTRQELKNIIKERIKKEGNKVDLNDIDVSQITNLSYIFAEYEDFNGGISRWDVSNATDMYFMFHSCESFNQDISNWDVSNVTDMGYMFYGCKEFDQDISNWDVSNVINMRYMFYKCQIEEKYKPNFGI